MPSEQATAAAEEIVNGDGKWESDPKQVKRVAKIIDAAFAPVVAERSDMVHRAVRGLKHLGSFKRTCGEEPHPLDSSLAGRVSHVFGLGMTQSIQLCVDAGEDPEWKSDPCERFDDHDWELDVYCEGVVCRRCGATDSVDVLGATK